MHIAFVLNTVLLFNINIHILLCSHKRLSACSGGHAAVCVEIVWREQLEPQSPPACRQTPRPHTNRLAELYSCSPTECCDTAAQRTRCNSIMDPRPAPPSPLYHNLLYLVRVLSEDCPDPLDRNANTPQYHYLSRLLNVFVFPIHSPTEFQT